MRTTIPTKWEYIRSRLMNLGFTEMASVARRIDDKLHECAYNPTTPAWDRDFENGIVDKTKIIDIINRVNWCTACHEEKHNCQKCKFGNTGGKNYIETSISGHDKMIRTKIIADIRAIESQIKHIEEIITYNKEQARLLYKVERVLYHKLAMIETPE